MIKAEHIAELKKITRGNNVLTSPEELLTYSYDATTLWSHMPDVVVLPESTAQVSGVMKLASAERIPVTPRGGGTNVSGGSIPVKGGIVLGTARMNRIIDISRTNLNATVEPGVVLQDFQAALAKQGLFFPPDPQSFAGCTMGGVVAENSGGPSCLKYGVAKQYVLGLEVVLADGQVMKLGGTGYELMMLFTGSEGTLGIITRITMRLLPTPRANQTIVAVFNDVAVAGETVTAIIAGGVLPSKVEFVDTWTFDKFRGLLPAGTLDDAVAILLIQVDGLPEAVAAEAQQIVAVCRKTAAVVRVAADRAEGDRYWQARSAHFSDINNLAHTILNEDVSVPRDKIAEFIRLGQEAARRPRRRRQFPPGGAHGQPGHGALRPRPEMRRRDYRDSPVAGGCAFRRARHRAGEAAFPEEGHGPGRHRDYEEDKGCPRPPPHPQPGENLGRSGR